MITELVACGLCCQGESLCQCIRVFSRGIAGTIQLFKPLSKHSVTHGYIGRSCFLRATCHLPHATCVFHTQDGGRAKTGPSCQPGVICGIPQKARGPFPTSTGSARCPPRTDTASLALLRILAWLSMIGATFLWEILMGLRHESVACLDIRVCVARAVFC